MRYTSDEGTILLGTLPAGRDVTIGIVKLNTKEQAVLVDNTCEELVGFPGVYTYTLNLTELPGESIAGDYFYAMTDGVKNARGKFVLGGVMDEFVKISQLEDMHLGDWVIENKQMIMHKRDGSELARFNLYDYNNLPTNINAAKREMV